MKKFFFLWALCILPCVGFSQEERFVQREKSNTPLTNRFEVVQTSAATGTFRIDKYSGTVYFLGKNVSGADTWMKISRYSHPEDKPLSPTKVNYQIILSENPRKPTYLLNIHTGATWFLSNEKNGVPFWQPLQ